MEQRLPTQAKPACVGHQHQIVVMHTKSRSLGFARDDTSRGSWSEEHRKRNSAQVSVQKKDANLGHKLTNTDGEPAIYKEDVNQ